MRLRCENQSGQSMKSGYGAFHIFKDSIPMMKTGILILFCALAAGAETVAFAKAPRTKVAAAHDVRQGTPIQLAPIVDNCRSCFGCWQDLFDRNNPNNLRSDYPSPPAQPAQF
jgi:hypothetical protein